MVALTSLWAIAGQAALGPCLISGNFADEHNSKKTQTLADRTAICRGHGILGHAQHREVAHVCGKSTGDLRCAVSSRPGAQLRPNMGFWSGELLELITLGGIKLPSSAILAKPGVVDCGFGAQGGLS